MTQGPYRSQEHADARPRTWWAGGVAYAGLGLSGLSWIGTFIAAAGSERNGVLAARLAFGVTAFSLGALFVAKRTRYAPGPAGRVAAPLATGCAAWIVATVLTTLFFATVWRAL